MQKGRAWRPYSVQQELVPLSWLLRQQISCGASACSWESPLFSSAFWSGENSDGCAVNADSGGNTTRLCVRRAILLGRL
jgi:hypothetical protein